MQFNIDKKLTILIVIMLVLVIAPSSSSIISASDSDTECYGFIIKVTDEDSRDLQNYISNLVNDLLRNDVAVYWTAQNLSILTSKLIYGSSKEVRIFEKGCFIIPFTESVNIDSYSTSLLYEFNLSKMVPVFKIYEPLNNINVFELEEPKIAILSTTIIDVGNYLDRISKGGFTNYKIMFLRDIADGKLTIDYNLFIHGGSWGNGFILQVERTHPKTYKAHEKIREYVDAGGSYLSSCYGSYLAAKKSHRAPGLPMSFIYSPLTDVMASRIQLIDWKMYRALPGRAGYLASVPSNGISIRIVNTSNPIGFGLPDVIHYNEYYSGPLFIDETNSKTNTQALGRIEEVNKSELGIFDDMYNPIWDMKLYPERLRQRKIDKWINYSKSKSIWVTANYGEGKVVSFGTHPEYQTAMSPPRLVYNSIFYLTSKGRFNINLSKTMNISSQGLNIDAKNGVNISETVNFKPESNVINDQTYFLWNFGNNIVSNERNATYMYDSYGTKQVILCAANQDGIYINHTELDVLGNLQVEIENYKFLTDEANVFSADISGGFQPYTYNWSFGDGNYSNEPDPYYIYHEAGIYNAKLEITDIYGNNKNSTFLVIVNDKDYNFSINLEVEGYEGRKKMNEKIFFNPLISGLNTNIVSINLSYGDGISEIIENQDVYIFNHSYIQPGMHYPTLIGVNESGEKYYDFAEVRINHPPEKPVISGASSVNISERYLYYVNSVDVDGDKIHYITDLNGNGTLKYNLSFILARFPVHESGQDILRWETWFDNGYENLRIKAIDVYGDQSEWSEPFNVTVNIGNIWDHPFPIIFLRFLERHPNRFKNMQYIFGL